MVGGFQAGALSLGLIAYAVGASEVSAALPILDSVTLQNGSCSYINCHNPGRHAAAPSHADHLKMPAKIRADDGTFDTFLSKFVAINRSGLGLVNSQELAAYFNSLTAGARSSSSLPGGASRVATAVGNHC